jgi:plastocyanin
MRRILFTVCVVVLSACAGGGTGSQSPIPQGPASIARSADSTSGVQALTVSKNWNVGTGASNDYYAIQDLDFYPRQITIDAGDTITYHVASGAGGDAHTVSFVPPGQTVPSPASPADLQPAGGTIVDGTKFVNSGILVGGQTFTLHFPKAGVYKILCLFHEPAMESTVVVQTAGAAYPHTAQYYLDLGENDEWEDFFDAAKSVALFPFKVGGTTFAAGIDPGLVSFPPPDSTILRFLNTNDRTKIAAVGSITIKVGTVLTWVNETSNEPHTVTFALAGQDDVPNIPPDPAINVVAAPGITTYDGTHIVNSGTFVGGQKFMLKFTKPGKYFYGCVYHDNSGMTGWVTVTP